jgi:histidine ammonia-lyase
MEKLESHTSKEAAWRSRLQRQAQSGKTIAAFCRDESVSTASFHIWRAKLAAASGHAAQLAQPAAFIDLGTIASTADVTSMGHSPASAPVTAAGIDVRIDLGGGIVLTITRR